MKQNLMLPIASLHPDPAYDASPDERYGPCQGWYARGRRLNPRCSAYPGPLAVRSAAAPGTPVGAHHHASRIGNWDRHAGRPRHEPSRHLPRRDRQVQPSLFVRLDASRTGRDWPVHLYPRSARIVEPATEPAPLVEIPHHQVDLLRYAPPDCAGIFSRSIFSLRSPITTGKLGFACLGTWLDPPTYAIVARDQQVIHFRSRCAAHRQSGQIRRRIARPRTSTSKMPTHFTPEFAARGVAFTRELVKHAVAHARVRREGLRWPPASTFGANLYLVP